MNQRGGNPITWVAWGGAVTIAVVSTRNPLYLSLVLIATVIVYAARHPTSQSASIWNLVIRIGLVVASVSIIFNLLTAHAGNSTFARLPHYLPIIGGDLTVNALLYGVSSALAILSLIIAAATFGSVVDRAALLRTVPQPLSSVGVAAVIGLSFFPQTLASLREVRDAQAARGFRVRSVRDVPPLVVPVLSMGLEGAFNLAEAMESRAFGAKPPTRDARSWLFPGGIVLILGAVTLLIGGVIWPAALCALAGLACVVLGLVGQSAGRTSYRATVWRLSEWLMIAAAMATGALFAFAILFDLSAIEWSPFPDLSTPAFRPWLGVACLLLLVPATLRGGCIMIRFDGVNYQYPSAGRQALTDVGWCLESGRVAVVTGPSGSGKSTLARTINGLVPHFHGGRFGGTVSVNGLDTTTHSTALLSQHVGFVAQVPETQTVTDRVEDEIAFGLENLRLPRNEIRLRVEEMLDLLSLNHLRKRNIDTLSGGERQRVVIAAAMAMRPTTLVLDEPTSQLDPTSSDEILTTLTRMNHELGTTILLVEHRLDRVLGMSDQLLVLDDCGRVRAAGPTRLSLAHLPAPSPLLRVANELGWIPAPLTVREARAFSARFAESTYSPPEPRHTVVGDSPSITFDKVTFGYERSKVLDRLSLECYPGSLTALMGRNGSGKTTLLKLVNGLLRPGSGRVRTCGQDVSRTSTVDLARDVAYLPQNAGTLLFNDSVGAELRFTLRCRGRDDDVNGMLERFGLSQLADRNPLDLSGGERLRAALAAVLIGRPSILLLDEPTRGIDGELKQRLGEIFRQLADQGTTVLLATHDVDLVAEFADRVVILGDGEVVADGSPHEVMPGSLVYSTQINRVFGGRLLTVDDVRDELMEHQ